MENKDKTEACYNCAEIEHERRGLRHIWTCTVDNQQVERNAPCRFADRPFKFKE